MSLVDLANNLRQQLPETGQGTIVLDKTSLDSAGGDNTLEIIEALQNYLALEEPQLKISNIARTDIVDPKEGEPLNISVGDIKFLNVAMSVKIIQFDLKATTLSLIIQTKNFPNDWTLGTSFGELYGFPIFDRHLLNPSYQFSSEDKNNWLLDDNLFVELLKGLNFYAKVETTSMQVLRELVLNFLTLLGITSVPEFYLFGQIDRTKPIEGYSSINYPKIDLSSSIFGELGKEYNIFGFLKVKSPCLGVRVVEFDVSEPGEGGEKYRDASLDFYFQLPIQLNEVELNFSASLIEGSSFLIFSVNGSKDQEHALTPGTLFQLMAGQDWLQQVPAPLLAVLSAIRFYGFSMTVFLAENATKELPAKFNVSSIRTTIGSTRPIKLFDPLKEFEFWLNWTILNPINKEQRMSLMSFHAEMGVGDIGVFGIEITESQ